MEWGCPNFAVHCTVLWGTLKHANFDLGLVSEHLECSGIVQTVKRPLIQKISMEYWIRLQMYCLLSNFCCTVFFDKALESRNVRSENGGIRTQGGNNPSEYRGNVMYTPMKESKPKAFREF